MDDPLDNDLKNRIREVFDNYEDTSADEGWLQLREKFPEKAKRRPVAWLWWGSAAAILLAFLGIGIWLANKPVINNNPAVKIKKTQTDSALYTETGRHKNNTGLTDSAILHKQQQALNNSFKNYVARAGVIQPKPLVNNQKFVSLDIEPDMAGQSPVKPANKQPLIVKPTDNVKTGGMADKENTVKPEVYATAAPVIKDNLKPSDTPAAVNSATKTKKQAAINSPMELFANDAHLKDEGKPEKQVNTDKKVRFSIYAATYFNYAKGSNNQVNVGAGFTSDIRITSHLKLSTGVSIAQNSLGYAYASQIPLSTSASNNIAVTSNIAATAYKAQGQLLETAPALKNYNANLMGLDIPVNLKYMFNPKKNDTYVSAGLSSGTFINETYTYNYSYPTPTTTSTVPTKDVATKNNFNGFYFAKTLNFAFGIGYPLGKTNKLIIEPFIKYPLDGLGSQQLRFGAGGVNLKFNFKTQK